MTSALLILRLVLGLTLAAHGFNKFFGGGTDTGHRALVREHRDEARKFHATVAATTETPPGLGLAAGLLTPIPAAGFVSLMLVAAWTVHRANGFFIVKEGWEYNLVLAVSAVVVATLGAGQLSLDWLIFGQQLARRLERVAALGGAGSRRSHRPVADLLPAAGQTKWLAAGALPEFLRTVVTIPDSRGLVGHRDDRSRHDGDSTLIPRVRAASAIRPS